MWHQLNEALSLSVNRIITGVANFLPGLLALFFAVLLAFPVAWMLSRGTRKFLQTISFDERLDMWGFSAVADLSPKRSPTLLASRLVHWTILLLGLLVGLTALDANLTSGLAVRALTYLPNIVVAAIVLMVGSVVARFLAQGVLISAVNMQIGAARLLSLGVKWLILVVSAAMAMEHLGVGGSILHLAFAILYGGIVLGLALAVGLGSKDVVSRSWERQIERSAEEQETPIGHL
jgi:hypothetical protein